MKTIKASTVVREVRRYIGKVPLPEEMVTTEADRVESLSRTLPTDFVLKRAVSAVEDIVSRVSAMHVPALMTSEEAFWGGDNGTFSKTVMRQLRGRVYRLPSGVTTINYGDVNDDGDITSQDASLILQHIEGSITLTPEQIERGDVTGTGELTERDARLIQQYVVGLIGAFPVQVKDAIRCVPRSPSTHERAERDGRPATEDRPVYVYEYSTYQVYPEGGTAIIYFVPYPPMPELDSSTGEITPDELPVPRRLQRAVVMRAAAECYRRLQIPALEGWANNQYERAIMPYLAETRFGGRTNREVFVV